MGANKQYGQFTPVVPSPLLQPTPPPPTASQSAQAPVPVATQNSALNNDYRPPFLLNDPIRQPGAGAPPRDYGRADLNPAVPPGPGGMIFPMPQRGVHPADFRPPGVPPGARYDPPGPGTDPTRFGPEPDHLRRPGGGGRGNFDGSINK